MHRKTCNFTAPILTLLLCGTVFSGVRNERWRWSNPLPHGNNVLDMFVTSELAVQVGDAGTLYVQRLDERWVPASTGTGNYLRSATLLGDRIIATGANGCIIWSDDGTLFQPAQLVPANTLDWFEGVAASAQRAVAVGDYGTIYTSTNGAAWNEVSPGVTNWLRGVAFGATAFVAVGENGKILRAPSNGTSWSSAVSGTTEHLNRVRFLGTGATGQFYAVGDRGTLLGSVNGTTWTTLASGTTNDLFDVALNNTGLLLVGDQEIRMKANGGTSWVDQIGGIASNAPPAWTYLSACGRTGAWLVAGRTGLLMEGISTNGALCSWQPSPAESSHAWLWDATVQGGIHVAVGDLACIQTSLDGILWAREVVPVSHTNTVLLGVGGNTNLLLAVGNGGSVLISQSGEPGALGVVWTNLPPFTTNTLQGIAAADGRFIVAGANGKIFTSPDGTNWTGRATPTANFLSGVAIGPGACVAVGDNGTLLRAGPDGAAWTSVPLGTANWIYRVRWLNGQFVAVGENGALYTSPNGTNWTLRTSGTTRWLTDAVFLDGTWFVTGYQGTLLASTNMVEWTPLPLPTIKSLFSATAHDGQLAVVGVEGVILRNQVVPAPSPVRLLDYHQSTVVDTNALASTYELFLFGGLPDQFFEFQSGTNLVADTWEIRGELELYDPSGTLYAIRTRDATNTPPAEFYRTQLVP